MDIYSFINSFDNSVLFRNITIIVLFIFFSRYFVVGLNIILGLFLATVVIIYFYNKQTFTTELAKEQLETKKELIKPSLQTIDDTKKDIIEFLFSIQDFYIYNPPAFEEMVENLKAFFKIYEIITKDVKHASYYYQVAESKKANAVNSLGSIIFNIPSNDVITDKYNRSHERLETLLGKYLNEMYDKCSYNLRRDGYNVFTRLINVGPQAYNTHVNNSTWQFY